MDTAAQLAEDILQGAQTITAIQCTDSLKEALNAAAGHPDERPAVRRHLVEGLARVSSPQGAGLVAIWLGACAEGGDDPAPIAPGLLQHFLRLSRTRHLEGDRDLTGEEHDVLEGLQLLGQSLVAHLSRCPADVREALVTAEVLEELRRVEHDAVGAMWLLALLTATSGELVVLHGVEPKGARVRYHNLSSCFHLFTLLQATLAQVMPGAGTLDDQAVAVARGQRHGQAHDRAWWHFGLGTVPRAELGGTVWGEAHPSAIPEVDGVQVLLLWPPMLGSRSWDAGFFGPYLEAAPPGMELVELLSDAEVGAWRARLGLEA